MRFCRPKGWEPKLSCHSYFSKKSSKIIQRRLPTVSKPVKSKICHMFCMTHQDFPTMILKSMPHSCTIFRGPEGFMRKGMLLCDLWTSLSHPGGPCSYMASTASKNWARKGHAYTKFSEAAEAAEELCPKLLQEWSPHGTCIVLGCRGLLAEKEKTWCVADPGECWIAVVIMPFCKTCAHWVKS